MKTEAEGALTTPYAYHSALHPPKSNVPARRHEGKNGIAFVHDLMDEGLTETYNVCDVLYAEIPWKDGVPVFNARAGLPFERTYEALMKGVTRIIQQTTVPVVILTGKAAAKAGLCEPDLVFETLLHGGSAMAACYRLRQDPVKDSLELLTGLAKQFNCVGDFCCGYGRAGRVFAEMGKRYVMSDFNPDCIGYIQRTFA